MRRLDPRLYLFGLGQYEHDPFIGFDNRYTAGIGAGQMSRVDSARIAARKATSSKSSAATR